MRRILVILCVFAVLATGCGKDKDDDSYISDENLPQLRAEWKQEYDAWKALDIQDYQFTWVDVYIGPYLDRTITEKHGLPVNFEFDYWNTGDEIITVKNGIVVEMYYKWYGKQSSGPDERDLTYYPTIDTFFNMIFGAFDQDEKNGQEPVNDTGILGVKNFVSYNRDYHFPEIFLQRPILPKDYRPNIAEKIAFEMRIEDFMPLDN